MSFIDFVTYDRLKDIFLNKINYSDTVGSDKISSYKFKNNLQFNLEKIIKDLNAKKYKFKPYKVILIPKKVNSFPRKVCVPTVRDRIVIEAMKEYLYEKYKDYSLNFGISNLINNFTDDYKEKKYSYYIKIDLTTFFDKVNHDLLIKKIKRNINDDIYINLLSKMLLNDQKYNDEIVNKEKIGIPQGLSISMVLANIFMLDIDNNIKKINNISYYRYVDDIIVLCDKRFKLIYWYILFLIRKNKLLLNKKKTEIKKVGNEFSFLGYCLKGNIISVRNGSLKKIENSLEKTFKKYKQNGNLEELKFRLNLKVSGILCNNKKYGWLFYFNRINDLEKLYHLDDLLKTFKKRYKVPDMDNHTFVESYYQMKNHNIKDNSYFFNVDRISTNDKIYYLVHIFNNPEDSINTLLDDEIDFIFKKHMFRMLKSVESDLDNIS